MTPPLHRLLAGPFHFLVPSAEEVQSLFPEASSQLPQPQRIFLEDEAATPLYGFPVLLTSGLRDLEAALEATINSEEKLQIALFRRQPADSRAHQATWERYGAPLKQVLHNVLSSSYGHDQAAIFILHHSLSLSRLIRDSPRRILRDEPGLGRAVAEQLRYRVVERLLDRLVAIAYDVTHEEAREQERPEQEVFPSILIRLRDNLLIASETHISSSLEELTGYFQANLNTNGREFAARFEAVTAWHEREFGRRPAWRETARLIGAGESEPRELVRRPGYLRWLAAQAESRQERELFPPQWVDAWEGLLRKLKEFELLQGLRKLVLPVERNGTALVAAGRRSRSSSTEPLQLSPSTRPLDFLSSWVVSPEIERSGLIYDISDFSELLARLRWGGTEAQDDSLRSFFRFQRRIHRAAATFGLRAEKYLGDGAFFSSRRAQPVLLTAIHLQRAYADALRDGLPFDRGLRIALGFGSYRLIPLRDEQGGAVDRYEFFGQGLIELSRLTSGKSSREIDEVRLLLITLGYPESAVNRFFAPLLSSNVELVDRTEEARRFYAYVNRNGSLVNEGIVATARFVQRFAEEWRPQPSGLWRDAANTYVIVTFEQDTGVTRVGLRKLGVSKLKGLDRLVVYEVVDASGPEVVVDAPPDEATFTQLLETAFAEDLAQRNAGPEMVEQPMESAE